MLNEPVVPVPPVPEDDEHEVLLVEVQITVVLVPDTIELEAALTVTAGGVTGGAAVTVTVLV